MRKAASFKADYSFSLLAQAIVFGQGLVTMPIVIKTAGVDVYGIYVLALSTLTLTYGVSTMGIGFRARRLLPSARNAKEEMAVFLPQALVHLVLLGIASLIFNIALNLVLGNSDETRRISAWVASGYLLSSWLYGHGIDFFRYGPSVAIYNLCGLAGPPLFVSALVIAVLWYGAPSVDLMLGLQATVYTIIGMVCLGLIAARRGLARPRFVMKEIIADAKLGFPLVIQLVTDTLLAAGDRYVLGILLGAAAVGTYQPGYALGVLILLVPRASTVMLPRMLARLADTDERSRANAVVGYSLRGLLLLGVPFVAGAIMLGRPILTALTTPAVAAQAAVIAPIVAVGAVAGGITLTLSNIAFVAYDTRAILRANLIPGIVNVVGNVVLLSIAPMLWIPAVSYAICNMMGAWLMFHRLDERWRPGFQRLGIVRILGATAIMLGVLFSVDRMVDGIPATFVGIFGGTSVGIVTYAVALIGIGGLTIPERKLLSGLFTGFHWSRD